jgi:SCY1-like protein 1
MPDTVLPSPGVSASGANTPRMGAPATENSWTGWAISNFTNKLAAASGQIQQGANGAAQRPSSVPPVPTNSKPTVPASGGAAPRPGMALAKSTAAIPTIMSPDPAAAFNDETEDFSGDWGGFGDDGIGESSAAAQEEEEEDPWGTPTVVPSTSKKSFNDQGEPDFAGWLAAQNQSKKPATKILPKGLGKPSTAPAKKPIVSGQPATTAAKKVVPPKKEVKKEVKSTEDEEDGWGDAW